LRLFFFGIALARRPRFARLCRQQSFIANRTDLCAGRLLQRSSTIRFQIVTRLDSEEGFTSRVKSSGRTAELVLIGQPQTPDNPTEEGAARGEMKAYRKHALMHKMRLLHEQCLKRPRCPSASPQSGRRVD
jgi:hypothetical protein